MYLQLIIHVLSSGKVVWSGERSLRVFSDGFEKEWQTPPDMLGVSDVVRVCVSPDVSRETGG